jgi:hypothetical protein
VTALQRMYLAYRDAGCGHHEALDKLAVKLDLDRATVARVLDRAEGGKGKKTAYARFSQA